MARLAGPVRSLLEAPALKNGALPIIFIQKIMDSQAEARITVVEQGERLETIKMYF